MRCLNKKCHKFLRDYKFREEYTFVPIFFPFCNDKCHNEWAVDCAKEIDYMG